MTGVNYSHGDSVTGVAAVVKVSAASPTTTDVTPEKKKKKRGLRLPSFSSKKKDK